jgi:hypothetical protein
MHCALRSEGQWNHPVAGELIHRTFEPVDAGGRDLEKILDDAEPLFGIEPFGEVHRAFDIGEQPLRSASSCWACRR